MIPKIIHQIWEGKNDPLPDFFKEFAITWKENHPDWKYEFWDGAKMDSFVQEHFPDFCDIYYSYPHNVQRWDAIRYLILYKIGGLYVDFDYESVEPIDEILQNDTCYFASEPKEHTAIFKKEFYFNNALMASEPEHPFFKIIIDRLKTIGTPVATDNKMMDVLNTTGPLMLTDLYEKYENKNEITLVSPELVSPWSKQEVDKYLAGDGYFDEKILEKKMRKAVAIHYFWGSW